MCKISSLVTLSFIYVYVVLYLYVRIYLRYNKVTIKFSYLYNYI